MPRRTPYTTRGIARIPCAMRGCRNVSYATWQVCADGRVFRAICREHDIQLNNMVLEWIGDPERETKMRRYREKVLDG